MHWFMRIKNLESPKIKQFEICFPYNNYVTVDYSLKYDRYLCINSNQSNIFFIYETCIPDKIITIISGNYFIRFIELLYKIDRLKILQSLK